MQEGDLVGALQKTLDLIGQLREAAQKGPLGTNLVPLLDEADALLRRGVVQASYQWAVRGLPEATENADDDWDIRIPPEDEPTAGVPDVRDRKPRRRVPAFIKRRTSSASGAARPRTGSARRRR
jgi:hypothetical protein